MAGLGEVCTHVATTLFYLYARPNTTDEQACTSQLSAWPVPPLRAVDMVPIQKMEFTKEAKPGQTLSQNTVSVMEQAEMVSLLRKLQDVGVSPVICRIMEPFASEMVSSEPHNLPRGLGTWFDESFCNKPYEELIIATKNMNINITTEEVKIIEENTRNQSKSSLWFKYRAGRITASQFKFVCRTSLEKPSLTVLKSICYPEKVLFHSKATSYGLKYEKTAIKAYEDHIKCQHENFILSTCGLIISIGHPELGASPDGLISCDCCGLGCLEVKCPYLLNSDVTLQDFATKRHTCLISLNGKLVLDRKHCYFYQVQLQMFVTKRKFCDFVIWSRNYLFIERIYYDDNFCLENVSKVLNFHKYVIKPELLSRHFTEKSGMAKLNLWCVCKKPDDGRPMLKCDNDDCITQWFHFDCMNILQVPDTHWFCLNCS